MYSSPPPHNLPAPRRSTSRPRPARTSGSYTRPSHSTPRRPSHPTTSSPIPSTATSRASSVNNIHIQYTPPPIPPAQTLTFRNIDSLRAEYAAIDAQRCRRRSLWVWLRESLKGKGGCMGGKADDADDGDGFWEEGGREGSVRRYRLVLPEKDDVEESEEVKVEGRVKGKGKKKQ